MAGWKKRSPQGDRYRPSGAAPRCSGVGATPAPKRQRSVSSLAETASIRSAAGSPVIGQGGKAGGSGGSAPVGAIDVDIAMRQVAGPNPGLAAAEADIDDDLHLPAL